MRPGSRVRIKSNGIVAKVMQIGGHGLLQLSSDEFSFFDRTIFRPQEVEEMGEVKIYE